MEQEGKNCTRPRYTPPTLFFIAVACLPFPNSGPEQAFASQYSLQTIFGRSAGAIFSFGATNSSPDLPGLTIAEVPFVDWYAFP
jgi:hypothetical protein